MIENLLTEFRKNSLSFEFKSKTKNSFKFDPVDIDFAIQCLNDFFSEKKFNVSKKITNIDIAGLNANENWITYHLAQSGHSIGSILLILEVSCLISYFSSSTRDKEILSKKLKKKNGDINDNQVRSSLFELYTAVILEKAGLKVLIDDNSNMNKPLDISIISSEGNITVECQTICETEIEKELINIVSYLTHSYFKIIEKHKNNHSFLQYLPVTFYLCIKDKTKLKLAIKLFKESLIKYQSDIQMVSLKKSEINIPYFSPDSKICLFNIEPYKDGLYETYSGFHSENDIFLKFKLFPDDSFRNSGFIQNIEFKFKPKSIEEKILDALKNKLKQHRGSITNKIFFFEYENYLGIRVPFDEKSISQDRIKELLKNNEIVCLIHKDSTHECNIKRNLIVIAKEENYLTIKLKQLILNPFIFIN